MRTSPIEGTRPGTRDGARPGTRRLLTAGAAAGPLYVVVSLAQALTREGFDLGRHPWSLLSNGALGWIQITNFVVCGLLVIAAAAGLRRALTPGAGARWIPRLITGYGAGLVAAGVFRADPAAGFPVGTPETASAVSWHGLLHFAAGGIGFTCLAAACLVFGRRYAREGRPTAAVVSRAIGVVFFASFVMLSSSGGARPAVLGFVAAVIVVWTWSTLVCLDRRTRA
jgi:hypothetical membrane protein